jgi:hypothetical protein
MTTETITHRTLRSLGHSVTVVGGVHTLKAAPERAGKHGEISESDWTIVATALADSDTDSREWWKLQEDWAVADEARAIRKARAA